VWLAPPFFGQAHCMPKPSKTQTGVEGVQGIRGVRRQALHSRWRLGHQSRHILLAEKPNLGYNSPVDHQAGMRNSTDAGPAS
jgi:hypothetical protein